ncbi:MAG: c-type cytochrome [Methylococcaceae bacterium]
MPHHHPAAATAFALLMVLMLAVCPLSAAEAMLDFVDEGKPVRQLSRKQISEWLPVLAVTVENPGTGQPARYQGAGFSALLTLAYGERWKRAELIKLVTRDGYQPVMPVSALSRHSGLMAYAASGADTFGRLGDGHGGMVDPGPFYLVWENIRDGAARKDPQLQWPWQVVAVELTRLSREYPQAAPLPATSDQVRRGFNAFIQHCAQCHQINGEGGVIGPELNYPVNVTEYWRAEWLPRFIANPQAIRHNSHMTGLGANQSAVIEDIVSYLGAMTARKLAPK